MKAHGQLRIVFSKKSPSSTIHPSDARRSDRNKLRELARRLTAPAVAPSDRNKLRFGQKPQVKERKKEKKTYFIQEGRSIHVKPGEKVGIDQGSKSKRTGRRTYFSKTRIAIRQAAVLYNTDIFVSPSP
jgi:hypothetical protein